MRKIIVTMENCEEVAAELVEELFDKPLRVVSFFRGKGLNSEPKAIPAVVKLLSGFTFENGRLIIPLKPIRRITWDLNNEKVSITYLDDGMVIIERALGTEKTIFRVIVES
ncbi:TPA: hypothetical protein DIU27_01110 [Candidatus Collierbacteria bacterium]|uniref:Uncharacterized protein n=1 Tax=Candidatus Collierbacteria bacterium GW2011_GWB2_44_22 TaxID=1618387 RepID=A0A0G1HX28_9BACT|nr:MAG: hypothetical protein UW31_C0010G0063 [Candidatus Collierbacteria bacterium GW2011_GWA2_44_13]KKT50808.1 MAG: hypothetical protein UW42_C0014G0003 [Candidatus Collierbacteria bacterium GW2011_GWB1_44_197]KKT51651.1 MAG: hypothetical protein UW44_C0009G0015 [Candidatus Collierbacteria bacterium GW2011_GWB2_44_22]KKT62579.1 MAG: hypothetical protein UW56_C0005G0015 [Candidatus Collierbacteria bacterium GW2011_GWD1_44_27]KKT66045.1 MAG: hypothetical protein UW58_C0014G0032 [Candidatus Colli